MSDLLGGVGGPDLQAETYPLSDQGNQADVQTTERVRRLEVLQLRELSAGLLAAALVILGILYSNPQEDWRAAAAFFLFTVSIPFLGFSIALSHIEEAHPTPPATHWVWLVPVIGWLAATLGIMALLWLVHWIYAVAFWVATSMAGMLVYRYKQTLPRI